MKQVRDWSADHDGAKPSPHALKRKKPPGTVEEAAHGQFLAHWKDPRVYDKRDKPACDFVMRRVAWWKDHADGSKAAKGAHAAERVNAMLKDGYGHPKEPAFDGKKAWPAGGNDRKSETFKVYTKMVNMVGGQFTDADVDRMLEGVDGDRAAWYRAQWTAHRLAFLARNAKSHAEAQARGYANGGKVGKKRKRDDAPEVVEEDEEEAEEDEEDDEARSEVSDVSSDDEDGSGE